MTSTFIHLHVHSEYSLIDGLVQVDKLIAACIQAKMPAVALTDHCNLFAAIKFYKAAISKGIKPILGIEILIASEEQTKEPYHLILLCQNNKGYKNLLSLISKAYTEGQKSGQPLILKSWLKENNEGLIALSAGLKGDIGQALIADNKLLAEESLSFWQQCFTNRFYLEISRTGRMYEEDYIAAVVSLAQKMQAPLVATNDVRFLEAEDFEAHEARVCIHQGCTVEDPKRPRIYNEQQYFRNSEEMQELFKDLPEALSNSYLIAKRCNLQLVLGKVFLPNFPVPQGIHVEQYLARQARAGLEERLLSILDSNDADYVNKHAIYVERLEHELSAINKTGFAGYFLIVADFIAWSVENGIPVGPGRGSGAGSLVAYSLRITGLDPIAFELLFERFLNPERVSMPDFDIDFCMDGRDRVIDYVIQRYGHASVAQIITFGTMTAKAVVRDVGRVLAYPYGFVDKIAKLIPFELGITLEKALAQEELLKQRYEQEEDVKSIIDLASKLEGVVRNAGKHAGGVVIAPSQISDFTPLYCESDSTALVTQFDKDDVEAVGLVKFDFLGLRTLTIIDWALKTINKQRESKNELPIEIESVPMADPLVFKLLKACQTTGVFQLESRGMKDLIKRLQPNSFEDMVPLVALFRPGPLQSGMVEDFINRKHGVAHIKYAHPDLESVLKSTYGVILYQEQVMQIAQVLAGYTLGSADILRKAMGKKKPEEMMAQRTIFIAGAEKKGVATKTASEIFDLMEKFAGYGFNKSHSAAYALVSYQTAWLKANYPSAFMAAVLSADMDHTDKVVRTIEECRAMRLEILAPDINQSEYHFTVAGETTIRYGLGAIKGAGEGAIAILVEARISQGPFKDLFDLCCRVDNRKLNRRVLESLIKAGSFDCFGVERAMLMASLDKALQMAEAHHQNNQSGQNDLFGLGFESTQTAVTAQYVQATNWSELERLQGEKETLGWYITGHPLDPMKEELQQFISCSLNDLDLSKNFCGLLAGLIHSVRISFNKKGEKIAFISLEDGVSNIELAVFAEVFADSQEILVKDQLVILQAEGSIDQYSGNYKFNVKRVLTIESARALYSKYLLLNVHEDLCIENFLDDLAQCLSPYKPGSTPIRILYQNKKARAMVALGSSWKAKLTDSLLDSLKGKLGKESVKVCYD